MRLIPSDPDVQTIYSRIDNGDINLQPDFQRGEVWTDFKKRRLIDSILRDWHVPPIHVVEVKETAKLEVLDGQQRLVAIRDFIKEVFVVDGQTEPYNKAIFSLHGKKYNELPSEWRRRFDQFTIRIFKITDYEPSEPGELFFRLNQPTNLTSAETRNAFFGPARQQIKELVDYFVSCGLGNTALGFSNSRMAYHDVMAKVCYTIEINTLLKSVSAANLSTKFRSQESFSEMAIERARSAVQALGLATIDFMPFVRFNKATLFSWLCFIIEAQGPEISPIDPDLLGKYILFFEILRNRSKRIKNQQELFVEYKLGLLDERLLNIFNDKASSRVSNVASVTNRDIILWIFLFRFLEYRGDKLGFDNSRTKIIAEFDSIPEDIEPDILIDEIIDRYSWGETL